jgi:tRNA(fMet)-specific endonuclease VapC
MVCLETTALVDLLRGKQQAKSMFEEVQRTEDEITIAAPSVMELWTGALLGDNSETEKAKINELISGFRILIMDEKSSKESGEIEAYLIKGGNIIEPKDIMIAGITKANGEKLVTRDAHYARIPGLKLLKY